MSYGHRRFCLSRQCSTAWWRRRRVQRVPKVLAESSPESQQEHAASLWRAGAMNQSPTGQHYQQSKRRHSKGGLPIVKRMANRAAYHIRGAT